MEHSLDWPAKLKDSLADELWVRCSMPPISEYLAEHRPYFTWDELRSWIKAGHGVGLHTRSHPLCSILSSSEIEDEICNPARELRQRLGLSFLPFSYPFGDRLPEEVEREILDEGLVDCIFGIQRVNSKGADMHQIERAGAEEAGVCWPLYGRPLLSGLRS